MIEFISLTIRNFLSYGSAPTVIQLNRAGTTLIRGRDLDNTTNGEGANGVGKSTLINALTYGVYGKPVSSISLDNLVNNRNKKDLEVIVEFRNNDGVLYRVERRRKTKAGAAGNTVHLFRENVDETPASVDATNAEITRIIGIPYELFVRIVVFSASHIPFLDLPVRSHYATNQTGIIEELFGLTAVSAKAELLKQNIKTVEGDLKLHKVRIEGLEKEHTRHRQQVASAVQRVSAWYGATKTTIEELEHKLEKIQRVDIDKERELHTHLNQVRSLLKDATAEYRKHSEREAKLRKDLTKNELELVHLRDDKCPRCLQNYADAKAEIQATEQRTDAIVDELETVAGKWRSCQLEAEELTHDVNRLMSEITVDDLDELLEIKSQAETIRNKIYELQQAINPYLEPLAELEAVELDPINYEEVNVMTRRLEHQNFLLKLLTKKDSFVRKALLNKNIPYLNSRLQHYLQLIGLPHTVEFTHEMTANISQFDHEMDFGNLSAGQRARVNLALSFAFRDVLQSLHTKINVCLLDEVLDIGLDAVGVTAAVRMLKHKAREEQLSLYIISHREEIDAFDRVMTVQMTQGFSYIKEESL